MVAAGVDAERGIDPWIRARARCRRHLGGGDDLEPLLALLSLERVLQVYDLGSLVVALRVVFVVLAERVGALVDLLDLVVDVALAVTRDRKGAARARGPLLHCAVAAAGAYLWAPRVAGVEGLMRSLVAVDDRSMQLGLADVVLVRVVLAPVCA